LRKLVWILAVVALGLALAWLAGGGMRGAAPAEAPREARATVDERANEATELHTAAASGPARASAPAAPEEPTVAAAPPPAALSGTLLFADGVPANAVTLAAATVEQARTGRHDDAPRAETDANGRFAFAELPAGPVRLVPVAYEGSRITSADIGLPAETFAAGDRDVTARLPVLRVRVELLGPDGEPVPEERIWMAFTPDPDPSDPGGEVRTTERTLFTGEDGLATTFPRSSGLARFVAYTGEGRARCDVRDVRIAAGISARTIPLVAVPLETSAALRVRIDCREPGGTYTVDAHGNVVAEAPLGPFLRQPFLVRLTDEETGLVAQHWNDAGIEGDGYAYGLAPGSYLVTLVNKLGGEPSLYDVGHLSPSRQVELVANEHAEVVFPVPCGGRIALTIVAPDDPPAEGEGDLAAGQSRVFHRTADGGERRLNFSEETDRGWLVSKYLPHGRRRTSEKVLEPGRYDLRIESAHLPDRRVAVDVAAGRMSELVVDLGR
jgi:hypothetical protein